MVIVSNPIGQIGLSEFSTTFSRVDAVKVGIAVGADFLAHTAPGEPNESHRHAGKVTLALDTLEFLRHWIHHQALPSLNNLVVLGNTSSAMDSTDIAYCRISHWAALSRRNVRN